MVQTRLGRRRIIKRPRLTRALDEANAPLVLLVTPAGYGKTTLARQWLAEGSRRHAWYTATPPSSDVSALALGLARALETIVPGPADRMQQRLLAVPTSEEEPEVVADILLDSASAWPDDAWLVVDDYHHIGASTTADAFFARFARAPGIRLLITSRTNPQWATARGTTYGDMTVLGVGDLALTPTESASVLGVKRDDSLVALLEVTKGWPVVTGLAAVTGGSAVPELPSPDDLYEFLADEVFNSASPDLRALLCQLAFVSSPTLDVARHLVDEGTADELLEEAERLGLVERERERLGLHPLLRDFLKVRFAEYPAAVRQAAIAILTVHVRAERAWDDLFELFKHEPTPARIDALIRAALRELVTEGRLGTLAAWCEFAQAQRIETPSSQLALAELNLAGGNYLAALPLAIGAAGSLDKDAGLSARAWIVAGRSSYFLDAYGEAIGHFERAENVAGSEEDRLEASWGHFLTMALTEEFDSSSALTALKPIANAGLDGVLRYANAQLVLAERFGGGATALDATLPLVPFATNARNVAIRTSFLNAVGRALLEQSRYDEGSAIFVTAAEIAKELGLRFVLPNALIGLAIAEHGRRRFGRASALLRRAETEARAGGDVHVLVHCEILRVRTSISLGALDDAVTEHTIWPRKPGSVELGELTACRALAHACAGQYTRADELVAMSRQYVGIAQTRLLQVTAGLIVAAGRSEPTESIQDALGRAVHETWSLDYLVTACRGAPFLIPMLCTNPQVEPLLAGALRRSRDAQGLPRESRADNRFPSAGPAFSPREEEVFALLCRGSTNKQMAQTLFISDVTVKVHLRHIYRKLGVTNRLEAVARGLSDLIGPV